MSLPNKKYRLILADPAWKYNNVRTGGSMNSGAAHHYNTMSMSELFALDIPSISEKDSVLFLWVTVPLLPEGIDLLKHWGFKYKTAIFWRKIMSLGMGFWFRGQVEVCLLGVRGKVKAFRSQRINIIESKVRRHSQKPEEMYELIESLGIDSKIELFAREKRSGWDSWGDELSTSPGP